MSNHTISMELSQKSIDNAIKEIERYRKDIMSKCERFCSALAQEGITVAKQNVGNFGKYLVFSVKTQKNSSGCTAIMYASEIGKIVSTWQTSDGLKSVDVSPLLMAEFGSGRYAQNPKGIAGVGQGTFPGQLHAFDREGWFWRDEQGELHHSYGLTPSAPMYKAALDMETKIMLKAKEVFG